VKQCTEEISKLEKQETNLRIQIQELKSSNSALEEKCEAQIVINEKLNETISDLQEKLGTTTSSNENLTTNVQDLGKTQCE
jgi:cell division protein FtsB